MRLPNFERAEIGDKLESYVLNPMHRDGKHKARVFESVLEITLDNRQVLQDAILTAARTNEDVEHRGDNGHGDVYVLRFLLKTDRGSASVLTAWIVLYREDFPRLVTCYIL
ncbi:MAG: hypothetical protein HUU46_11375 [Candidatus Hydrogenedentes bacterium]|nr:hypothetical protein [Candidatus Hydrogenedentota bacterium]